MLQLNKDFPNDRGIFCPLLLNTLSLNPGEGFFMGANEPHAYISGDCIECMALSDNVIRAALTPKYKDVKTLCDSLHYRFH
jgi:mannose-6-phosphate isomerase